MANVTSDLELTGVSGSNTETIHNPDGSVTVITHNPDGTDTRETTDTSGNVITQEIEYDANNNPIVTSYTINTTNNPNGGLTLSNDKIDTGYIAFDGNPFSIHMVYKAQLSANTQQKHILSVLSKVSGTNNNNSKYDGFIYYIYKSGSVRISVLTADGLGGGLVTPIEFKLSTSSSGPFSKVYEYSIDITYNPTNKSISATMNPGNTASTSQSYGPVQSNDFPNSLAGATVHIGGDDDSLGTNYTMNSIEIISFSISRTT